jgi:Holliday junction DNA helicase RuvA
MIAYLEGEVLFRGSKFVILKTGGIGYKIFTSLETLGHIEKKGERASFHTHLHVRENALELYGFDSMAELEMFEMLIGISGVGPKSAIGVLSVVELDLLKRAIAAGDTVYLTKISGIGRRIAEKMILELKDKLSASGTTLGASNESDALDALVSLGYTVREAREALRAVDDPSASLDERIKKALRTLGR